LNNFSERKSKQGLVILGVERSVNLAVIIAFIERISTTIRTIFIVFVQTITSYILLFELVSSISAETFIVRNISE